MFRSAVTTVIMLLAGSCFFIHAQASDDDIQRNLRQVDVQISIGNLSEALLIIEDILLMQPSNLEAQEKKINILIQQERSKDAISDIEEYISMYPTQPEYYYLRAVLNLQKQKYVKAIEDFNQAIQLDMPEESVYKVHLNRGMAYFYYQEYDLAESDFSETLSLNSNNAAAYHGKGMVSYELNQYEDAIAEFQRALKIEMNNPITHYNLAMSYFRLDDSENACYHFNKSCALGHRNACRLLMMECDLDISK